jgi:hypothetical protein
METLMPPPPRIVSARIDDEALHVCFADGRRLGVPLTFFPTLRRATPAERKSMRLETPWTLRWPRLDYDIGAEGLLTGARDRSDLNALVKTLRKPKIRRRKAIVAA